MREKDIEILLSLYHGNHLEKDDLERAKQLLHGMKVNLESRV